MVSKNEFEMHTENESTPCMNDLHTFALISNTDLNLDTLFFHCIETKSIKLWFFFSSRLVSSQFQQIFPFFGCNMYECNFAATVGNSNDIDFNVMQRFDSFHL